MSPAIANSFKQEVNSKLSVFVMSCVSMRVREQFVEMKCITAFAHTVRTEFLSLSFSIVTAQSMVTMPEKKEKKAPQTKAQKNAPKSKKEKEAQRKAAKEKEAAKKAAR
eukprot:g17161.t1